MLAIIAVGLSLTLEQVRLMRRPAILQNLESHCVDYAPVSRLDQLEGFGQALCPDVRRVMP